MGFSDWSAVAASNATTLGVNIAEGCPPSNLNDALRKAMADLRSAIDPTLATFLASTSLATARAALEVPGTTASVTAFNALTNAASKLPYMTGSDAWATTDFTSFARTLVDDGDAAAARLTLGALGIVASSLGASGYISFDVGGTTVMLQWGSVTVGANNNGTINYPSAYSSFSVCVVSGGPAGGGDAGSIHSRGGGTTTASVANTSGSTLTGYWLAIGV